jgi:hypothetical protein
MALMTMQWRCNGDNPLMAPLVYPIANSSNDGYHWCHWSPSLVTVGGISMAPLNGDMTVRITILS